MLRGDRKGGRSPKRMSTERVRPVVVSTACWAFSRKPPWPPRRDCASRVAWDTYTTSLRSARQLSLPAFAVQLSANRVVVSIAGRSEVDSRVAQPTCMP